MDDEYDNRKHNNNPEHNSDPNITIENSNGNKKSYNEYILVGSSGIHRHGVFAKKDIPKGTRIAEYVGIKVPKEIGTMIETETFNRYKDDKENHAATYMFEIDENWDLDGDIPDNDPKYINHSCDPNCEVDIIEGRIWIDSIKDIKKGEEITYNYGFEISEKNPHDFKHHPCKCGSKNCVGYILAEDEWPKMKELLAKQQSE